MFITLLRQVFDRVKGDQDKREQNFVTWCRRIKDPPTNLPIEEQLLECKKIIAETRYRASMVNWNWAKRFPWNKRRIM